MRLKQLIWGCVSLGMVVLLASAPAHGYSKYLPATAPSPPLPYVADTDYYSGPASVQMALNSCPDTTARNYVPQSTIYSVITAHNSEVGWYCDPNGVEAALEKDFAYSSCGTWSDVSSTVQNDALVSMLYWIDRREYLAAASIGSSEHWVAVAGFAIDGASAPPSSGTVVLQWICLHDPIASTPSSCMVSGSTWLTDPFYWGTPHNRPGSSWDNKYIAVVEPPGADVQVISEEPLREGQILDQEVVAEIFLETLYSMRRTKGCPSQILFQYPLNELKLHTPLLVDAGGYQYYWIPTEHPSQLAAVVNAYDGSIEEIRAFEQEQRYILDPNRISAIFEEAISRHIPSLLAISHPQLVHRPALSQIGRTAPIWEALAIFEDTKGEVQELPLHLSIAGETIRRAELPETRCVDFDDSPLGTVYKVGDTFKDSAVSISVLLPQWTSAGYAEVGSAGLAGALGQEILVNNVDLGFDFGKTLSGLSLNFGEYGGSLHIAVNGDSLTFADFQEIDGAEIGGVRVSVSNGYGDDKGQLKLSGTMKQFRFGREESWCSLVIGGQELWIDHVCPY